jgi:hypothetical protein
VTSAPYSAKRKAHGRIDDLLLVHHATAQVIRDLVTRMGRSHRTERFVIWPKTCWGIGIRLVHRVARRESVTPAAVAPLPSPAPPATALNRSAQPPSSFRGDRVEVVVLTHSYPFGSAMLRRMEPERLIPLFLCLSVVQPENSFLGRCVGTLRRRWMKTPT